MLFWLCQFKVYLSSKEIKQETSTGTHLMEYKNQLSEKREQRPLLYFLPLKLCLSHTQRETNTIQRKPEYICQSSSSYLKNICWKLSSIIFPEGDCSIEHSVLQKRNKKEERQRNDSRQQRNRERHSQQLCLSNPTKRKRYLRNPFSDLQKTLMRFVPT